MTNTWRRLGEIVPTALRNQPISWFKYVPHESIQEYLSKGWEIADDLRTTRHGFFAVLCVWKGDGEPK